jgi:putative ABC transport system ATP-binding protein
MARGVYRHRRDRLWFNRRMLEVRDLARRIGARTLFAGVSLSLAAGEVMAVAGESGVGKSTLLNCIAGLDRADAGEVVIAGTPLATLDEDGLTRLRRRHIGFVFQAFHILPHLTLGQNVALPLWLLGRTEAQAAARAGELLAAVGLAGRAGSWPRELSGGEMQRVAIARALAHGPGLLLADEPTGNLDPVQAGRVLDLLVGQACDAGAALLLVTHSMAAAARADRILRLTPAGLAEVLQ